MGRAGIFKADQRMFIWYRGGLKMLPSTCSPSAKDKGKRLSHSTISRFPLRGLTAGRGATYNAVGLSAREASHEEAGGDWPAKLDLASFFSCLGYLFNPSLILAPCYPFQLAFPNRSLESGVYYLAKLNPVSGFRQASLNTLHDLHELYCARQWKDLLKKVRDRP